MRYWISAVVIPAIVVAVDQLTKIWAIRFFDQPINICEINPYPGLQYEVSPVFDLALVCNLGVSFGLLGGDGAVKRWALTVFALLMVAGLLWVMRDTKDRLGRLSLGLVIGGAIGNAIDRALFGAVTDFLNFGDIGFKWVFNVADSAITVGVVGLLLSSFLASRAERAAA